MRTCVLHVGMAKTGSTSIQATLAALPPSPGFVFLQHGEANAARALSAAFMSDAERYRPNRKRGHDAQQLQRKGRQALARFSQSLSDDVRMAVLSSEMIPGFDHDTLVAMRDWLRQRFDRIRVLAYVREPAGYMESMAQQSLKNGNGEIDLERRYPDYRGHFEPLEQVFGREAIEYRLFEPAALHQGCVVRDFAREIGLSLSEDAVVRVNEGLSRRAVALLLIYRQRFPRFGHGPHAMRRNRALVRWLSGLSGPKLRLSPTLLRPVIEAHAEDLAWISARLDAPLAPRYAEESPDQLRQVEELLQLDPTTLDWLQRQTGEAPRHHPDGRLRLGWVARLMQRHVEGLLPEPQDAADDAAEDRQATEGEGLPEDKFDAAGMLEHLQAEGVVETHAKADWLPHLQRLLQQLALRLRDADGPVEVPGCGTFQVRASGAGVWRAPRAKEMP